MRRPTLSILAVVLSTACGPGPEPEQSEQLARPDLDTLNQELANTYQPLTSAQVTHFAPLCDERGYPLVGNIYGKGTTTVASEVCAAVRGTRK